MQENEQKLTIKIHRRFRRRRSSVLQRQNTDYHVFYTTLTFQAGSTAILNWVLELFSIINPVLILILKLYYFHTMDNRRQVFCCNHFVQRVCLPSTSRSHPTCLRSLLLIEYGNYRVGKNFSIFAQKPFGNIIRSRSHAGTKIRRSLML
jgi:hypothetical protein